MVGGLGAIATKKKKGFQWRGKEVWCGACLLLESMSVKVSCGRMQDTTSTNRRDKISRLIPADYNCKSLRSDNPAMFLFPWALLLN